MGTNSVLHKEVMLAPLQSLAKKSLYFLANQILGYKDVNMHTHREIIECLESNVKRKMIVVPRGCLKSSLACVAYPIWILINNPNARILIDSELYTNSKTFLREIKQHLKSSIMTTMFGRFDGTTWNDSEIIINQRTKTLKEASITVGGIGTTKVGQHYDYVVFDDLNSPKNSDTPEKSRKVIDHYQYNISILEPTGTVVLIGTRYSELDCIGHVLSNELGIKNDPKSGIYKGV